MQTDPIGYGDGMNMYAYVGGDPVNATDPTGAQSLPEGFEVPDEYDWCTGATEAQVILCGSDERPLSGGPGRYDYPMGIFERDITVMDSYERIDESDQRGCNQRLIDQGNRQVRLSNTITRYAGYAIAVGATGVVVGGVLAAATITTPIAGYGMFVIGVAGFVTSGAAILRTNGGVLQGRGGGGYQNARQGLVAFAIGNAGRAVSGARALVTRAAVSGERQLNDKLGGVFANAAMQMLPGQMATCTAN